MPFETDYCASEFALAGFFEALRAEVMSNEVDVNTIFPGAVEMEIIESVTNRIGFELSRSISKSPAAQTGSIVQDARFPEPELLMALNPQASSIFNKFMPGLMDLALGCSILFNTAVFSRVRRDW